MLRLVRKQEYRFDALNRDHLYVDPRFAKIEAWHQKSQNNS